MNSRMSTPGTYEVIATMPAMDGASQSVTVQGGGAVTVDFALCAGKCPLGNHGDGSVREQLTLDVFPNGSHRSTHWN